jgi:type I restriction enzyme S subunit
VKSYKIIDLLVEVISGEWGQEPDGENDVKVIRTTNFTNEGRLDLSKDVVMRNIEKKKVEKKRLQYGDIIIEKSGGSPEQPVGRVVYFDVDNDIFLCNNFTSILRPNSERVESKYLFYFLFYQHRIRRVLKYQNKTTGIINLKLDNYLNKIELVLPSREIQRKVVKILDKSYELIVKRKAQIEALDQLTQSVFLEMFGAIQGEKRPLSELCEINPPKKEVAGLKEDTIVSFVPMANVSEKGEIDLTEARKLGEVYKGFTYFKENDVLFAKITPCMENGKGAIAKKLINGVGFGSTEFHVLRPKEEITSEWLYYLTALPNFRLQAEKNMTGSAGQKRVPKQFFDKYKITKPPLDSQLKFKQIVTKIEKQKEIIRHSLENMETLYQSLLQRAFKGELFTEENQMSSIG